LSAYYAETNVAQYSSYIYSIINHIIEKVKNKLVIIIGCGCDPVEINSSDVTRIINSCFETPPAACPKIAIVKEDELNTASTLRETLNQLKKMGFEKTQKIKIMDPSPLFANKIMEILE